ncbi:DNA-protecting protein DprA [Lactococcus hircilactis]|uniref:DNA-protecting protein DprA n=1 Tax=Lactococcus hircilactis TaxID=1494462 RepID=A0A7X2D163_9LACT|nr:DNA-processing protein DprA [Lactococcus hircilactis]MQW40253.1 DNA-protecting protein DprA [Lactococcus hircilactis]
MIISNFTIYRWKNAGMTNLNVYRLLKYLKKNPEQISLRTMAKIGQVKSIPDFIERFKSQDVQTLREQFKQFPSFSILDACYPVRLKNIYNPPVLLFYQGNLELLSKQKIAFVGSRNPSIDGIKSVQKIIKEMNNHFVVVSGLAKGIDAASHIANLKNGGLTIAVIGTGLDTFYPSENRLLQEYLSKKQLLLTEYGPGEKALKFHFPERNRIIAGLAKGVVVAQAKIRSGSLITCERAMEEGRDVFAIPGSIQESYSAGCHHLIQQGAKLITQGNDILEEYEF